jgi:hypothetical protein
MSPQFLPWPAQVSGTHPELEELDAAALLEVTVVAALLDVTVVAAPLDVTVLAAVDDAALPPVLAKEDPELASPALVAAPGLPPRWTSWRRRYP